MAIWIPEYVNSTRQYHEKEEMSFGRELIHDIFKQFSFKSNKEETNLSAGHHTGILTPEEYRDV